MSGGGKIIEKRPMTLQDAELERLQALYDREKAAHRISVDEATAEARKAAFIEAAEIATATATDVRNGDRARFTASHIAMALKKKAEETRA